MHLASVLSWPEEDTGIDKSISKNDSDMWHELGSKRTWACKPGTRLLDVNLAGGVMVSEESPWEDWNDILLVVDTRHGDW